MGIARFLAVALALGLFASAAHSDNVLPPAPEELGVIRRNENGRLEAVRTSPSAHSPSAQEADGPAAARDESAAGKARERKAPSAVASSRTLVVGPREQIRSIQEAARIARDGDTI